MSATFPFAEQFAENVNLSLVMDSVDPGVPSKAKVVRELNRLHRESFGNEPYRTSWPAVSKACAILAQRFDKEYAEHLDTWAELLNGDY